MNFINMNDLAEILEEEYFPGNASHSGDHIFITRTDGKEFTVWINGDDDAVIDGVYVENEGFLSSFAERIAEAVNSVESEGSVSDEANEAEEESLAEALLAESAAIKGRISALDKKMEPFKDSFYTFLKSGIPTGYLSFSELTEPASAFSVDFDALTAKEVLFTTSANDWDNEEIFSMPLEYVNDPKGWEKEFSERVTNDRSFALGVFKKIPSLQRHYVETVKQASEENDDVFLVSSHYETEKWSDGEISALHVIVKSKGAVYRAVDFFDLANFANGLVESVGTFEV